MTMTFVTGSRPHAALPRRLRPRDNSGQGRKPMMSSHISHACVKNGRKRLVRVETVRTTALRITPRERDLLQLLADGNTASELSRHVGLNASRINALLERLFAVMGVATQT